jgi:tRNA A-37 threonylcarbamoyl transferase component Bud32
MIGVWTPIRLIGSGAVASVYMCRDATGREAAVKWMNHSHVHLISRFKREIESLKRLKHPAVTSYIDSGEEKGRPFLAMEHVVGTDLRLFAEKLHKRPSSERYSRCRSIGRSLCDALTHIHSIGLVHRDVKPSNVLISNDDRVVLSDFGVVKDPEAIDKTAIGVVVGTLAYAAPEQIQGDVVDARTDLFGLGATLYFVLTQKRPFEGLDRDLGALPAPPSRVDPGIPADLEGTIMRMLAADPSHRPRDAASVRALLSDEEPGGAILAGTRSTVRMVADCLERVSAGEALLVRPTGPAGTRKAWVGDLLRQGAQRRGIPVVEVLEWGAWSAVRERLDAGERLLVVSPHELEVPEHVSRVEIVLKPLSLADVRRSLVSVAPKVKDPASVAATLHEWTGGLPRLLADLLENHTENDDFSLPEKDAVNASVERFLEGLDMDEMEVLGTLSFAKAPLDGGTIEEITQVPIESVVQDLISKGIVVEMEGRFRLMGEIFRPAIHRRLIDPDGLSERVLDAEHSTRGVGTSAAPEWLISEVRRGIDKAEEALLGGSLSSGLMAIRAAVDLSTAVTDRAIKAEATIALANVLIRLGLLNEAGRRLADATALAHAVGRHDLRRLCHGLRAWVAMDKQPRSRASAASAVDRVLPMLDGADGRGFRPEDGLLYATWSRAAAVLGDKATHRRASERALEWSEHLDEPLALGIRLQLARGALVLRNVDQARDWVRPVVAKRHEYPLLGWEAGRLMAQIEGGIPPMPGPLSDGLSATVAEALSNRTV